jgi:cell division protein FtsX
MKKDKRLKRNVLRSYVVSTVSISLVLFLLGSVGYMLTAAIGTAFSLRENITISAELDNSVGSDQQATIKAELEKLSGVRKVQYVDKNTGFISYKSKNGRELKAMELPGLWNGAMSDWNTIFVEVPLVTFNPVKTVNDLLRDVHQ